MVNITEQVSLLEKRYLEPVEKKKSRSIPVYLRKGLKPKMQIRLLPSGDLVLIDKVGWAGLDIAGRVNCVWWVDEGVTWERLPVEPKTKRKR